MNNSNGVGIIGVGKYIPKFLITNDQVAKWTGISADSIREKTGITCRYVVGAEETASGMSAIAAQQALKMANISPLEVDLIIGCTFSGDYIYPAMACKVAGLIGAENAGAYDIMANCTAFQVGVGIASDNMKSDRSIKYVLVVGTALQSRFIDYKDLESAMYFSDGSGAAVLGKVPEGYGILASDMFTNSKVFDSVRLRGGGSSFPLRQENINNGLQYYEINGMEVWKQVIQNQPKVIRRVLGKIGKQPTEIDFFIFHQANLKLIEYLMAKMKLPMEKTFTNVERIGNTAEASIPIALCEAVDNKLINRNDYILISGVGAGFTFGATIMRWY
jgi:3-oxoacyl-[acyl-carrier-protein] synthase-3